MEAALQSPTSFNIKHWRFVRVTDKNLRQKIRAAAWDQAQVTDASELLVLCADIDAWKKEPHRYWRNAPKPAQDFLIPAIGKKSRPVHSFRLLVEPSRREPVAEACFTETSTIGLRWQTARRAILPRVLSDGGVPRVKTVARPAGPSRKAESDDIAGIKGLDARRAAKRTAEEA